jgi:hypothetical protein
MKIKGLYFKLNIEKPEDKLIFDYFENVKKMGGNKIEKLYSLIQEGAENGKNKRHRSNNI